MTSNLCRYEGRSGPFSELHRASCFARAAYLSHDHFDAIRGFRYVGFELGRLRRPSNGQTLASRPQNLLTILKRTRTSRMLTKRLESQMLIPSSWPGGCSVRSRNRPSGKCCFIVHRQRQHPFRVWPILAHLLTYVRRDHWA